MLTLLIGLGAVALIGFALYSSTRGHGHKVTESDLGGINAYDSYYGKDRYSHGAGLPCAECERTGCIGAGECRCNCHKAKSAT